MRRRMIAFIAAAGLALAAAGAGLFELSRARCVALVAPEGCRVHTTAPVVALSFDDGPTERGVNAILPELARTQAHATFFLIGGEAERRPELVRALLAAGHEVGNHTYSHRRNVGHSQAIYDSEIAHTQTTHHTTNTNPQHNQPPNKKKHNNQPQTNKHTGLTMV